MVDDVDVCQSGNFHVAIAEASFSRDFIGTALCSGTHSPGGRANRIATDFFADINHESEAEEDKRSV